MDANTSQPYKLLALVFCVAFGTSLALGFLGPRLMAPLGPAGSVTYTPPWLLYAALSFGLVAVITVPFAWRWLYRRRK